MVFGSLHDVISLPYICLRLLGAPLRLRLEEYVEDRFSRQCVWLCYEPREVFARDDVCLADTVGDGEDLHSLWCVIY